MRSLVVAVLLSACGPVPLDFATSALPIRPDDPRSSEPSYGSEDMIESVVSPGGAFRIHFTRSGRHAVPLPGPAVPFFVEQVARTYDEALTFYEAGGYRRPLSDGGAPNGDGGDDLFDVYLIDMNRRGTGMFVIDACEPGSVRRCAGHIRHENDFAGYGYPSTEVGNRILASHELFHAVQAAYAAGERGSLTEGTAVWATEWFDDRLYDFEGFIGAYLSRSDRTLDADGGGFDSFVYGVGIYFRFLEERYGPQITRALWERRDGAAADEGWLDSADHVIRAAGGPGFDRDFLEFSSFNLALGAAVAAPTYREAAGYPPLTTTAVAAPVNTGRLRMFPATLRAFDVDPGPRQELWVEATGAPLEGLFVAVLDSMGREPVARWPADEGARRFLVPAGAPLRVGLVDTRRSGPSLRPTLCVGDEAENAVCLGEPEEPEEPEQPERPEEPERPEAPEPDGSGGDATGGCAALVDEERASFPLLVAAVALLSRRLRSRRRFDSRP